MSLFRFVGLSVFLPLALVAGENDGLRAGAAKVDITPTQPCLMSGYAARTNLSTGVHDPLSARAVAFEHDGQRLVLVSSDIIGYYRAMAEHMRGAILEACKLKPEELLLAATHTHAAPTPSLEPERTHPNNVEFTKRLRAQLIKVVREALAGLKPVRVGVGTGASPVGVNRREAVMDSKGQKQIRLGRNPRGSTDKEVQVLQLREADSAKPLAVLFAYATHGTTLGPKNLVISGDVLGLAAQFVEKHLGGGIVAPVFAGASGDIDPWFRVLPEIKTGDGWIAEPVLLGAMLGEEVVHTANKILDFQQDGPVKSLLKTIELPAKTNATATVPFTITVARVGAVAFVGLGGEVFHEIGQTIKKMSPFRPTFILTHCNGGAGYLVVKEAYAEGGYEVKTTHFAPEAADIVIQEAVALLKQLCAGPS